MTRWKTISKKIVHRDKWSRLHVDHIAEESGAETDYFYIARTTVGMAVVPYFAETNEVLLVSQYRHPIKKSIWQFPGGGREKGMTFMETAKQELLEETGYIAGKLIDVGKFYPDPGISSDEGRVFVATSLVKKFDQALKDPLEKLRIKRVKLAKFEKMVKNGRIRDGWTLGAYTLFKLWTDQK